MQIPVIWWQGGGGNDTITKAVFSVVFDDVSVSEVETQTSRSFVEVNSDYSDYPNLENSTVSVVLRNVNVQKGHFGGGFLSVMQAMKNENDDSNGNDAFLGSFLSIIDCDFGAIVSDSLETPIFNVLNDGGLTSVSNIEIENVTFTGLVTSWIGVYSGAVGGDLSSAIISVRSSHFLECVSETGLIVVHLPEAPTPTASLHRRHASTEGEASSRASLRMEFNEISDCNCSRNSLLVVAASLTNDGVDERHQVAARLTVVSMESIGSRYLDIHRHSSSKVDTTNGAVFSIGFDVRQSDSSSDGPSTATLPSSVQVSFKNDIFRGSRMRERAGGALALTNLVGENVGSFVHFSNVSFVNNKCGGLLGTSELGFGGVISLFNAENFAQSALSFEKCTFQKNKGSFGGVALLSSLSNVWVLFSECAFVNNKARGYKTGVQPRGGAFYLFGTSSNLHLDLIDSTFVGHHAAAGGVIMNEVTTGPLFLNATSCAFVNNEAKDFGGVATLVQATALFDNCTFDSNRVYGNDPSVGQPAGGALYTSASIVSIDRCVFRNNSASMFGGSVQSYLDSQLTISRSEFSRNSAGVGGAAVSVGGSPTSHFVVDEASTMMYGEATYGGGVLLNLAAGMASAVGATITKNDARVGGGLYVGGDLSGQFGATAVHGNDAEEGTDLASIPTTFSTKSDVQNKCNLVHSGSLRFECHLSGMVFFDLFNSRLSIPSCFPFEFTVQISGENSVLVTTTNTTNPVFQFTATKRHKGQVKAVVTMDGLTGSLVLSFSGLSTLEWWEVVLIIVAVLLVFFLTIAAWAAILSMCARRLKARKRGAPDRELLGHFQGYEEL